MYRAFSQSGPCGLVLAPSRQLCADPAYARQCVSNGTHYVAKLRGDPGGPWSHLARDANTTHTNVHGCEKNHKDKEKDGAGYKHEPYGYVHKVHICVCIYIHTDGHVDQFL